eukprot:TRINITY_DN3064_c2_g1_i1.p1 TRINITY_DN3064_c2_g1~~TRINITY_DN3064_c2_g1_i1.p1  ORF type:complete len:338 (+),score=73.38 TRINITY_DN3064_c2_g1_i1:28-1041(+)
MNSFCFVSLLLLIFCSFVYSNDHCAILIGGSTSNNDFFHQNDLLLMQNYLLGDNYQSDNIFIISTLFDTGFPKHFIELTDKSVIESVFKRDFSNCIDLFVYFSSAGSSLFLRLSDNVFLFFDELYEYLKPFDIPIELYLDTPRASSYANKWLKFIEPKNVYIFGHGSPDKGSWNQNFETWMNSQATQEYVNANGNFKTVSIIDYCVDGICHFNEEVKVDSFDYHEQSIENLPISELRSLALEVVRSRKAFVELTFEVLWDLVFDVELDNKNRDLSPSKSLACQHVDLKCYKNYVDFFNFECGKPSIFAFKYMHILGRFCQLNVDEKLVKEAIIEICS